MTATFTESFNYLLAASGNITVTQGMSGSTTLTVTWTAGTAQSVSFTASGLPISATAAFSPGACPPTPTCTSQLTITTTASTPTGMSQITVTGSPLSKTTMFNLNVIPPSPEFDYTLPKPNDITVTQGASGSTTLTASLTFRHGAERVVHSFGLPSGHGSVQPGCVPSHLHEPADHHHYCINPHGHVPDHRDRQSTG